MHNPQAVCQIEIHPDWIPASPVSKQEDHDAIAFTPKTDDALLTLTTFDPSTTPTDAQTWVDLVAKSNRLKRRHVTEVAIGDFVGYYIVFDTQTTHIRAWAVRCGEYPMDVNYQCDQTIAGRDDLLVDAMLATVRRS